MRNSVNAIYGWDDGILEIQGDDGFDYFCTEPETERCTLICKEHQAQFLIVVTSGLDCYPIYNFKRFLNALMQKINTRMDFHTTLPLPVIIHMNVAGLMEIVKIPEFTERYVRAQFM